MTVTAAAQWIVIPKWDEFQHYKDRAPKWIKTYVELMSDDAYLKLSGHNRAVLHGIWLEYASSRCRLALDTVSLTRRLNLRVTMATLETLNHAGFIHFSASAPLAPTYANASPDKRRERTPLPPTGKHQCPHCQLDCQRDWKLTEHLANVHGIEEGRPL